MLGEEKTLPLPLLLQRQRAQSPTGDLALLAHRHLDERSWISEEKKASKSKTDKGLEINEDKEKNGKILCSWATVYTWASTEFLYSNENWTSVEIEFCPSTKMHVFQVQRMNAWCQALPCLTNVWLVSRRISQPSTIMRSIAKFFLMFSVSLTSSCIILRTRRHFAVTLIGTSETLSVNNFLQSVNLNCQNQSPILSNALNT